MQLERQGWNPTSNICEVLTPIAQSLLAVDNTNERSCLLIEQVMFMLVGLMFVTVFWH